MCIRNDVRTLLLILAAAFFTATASAQQYDLLLRGGQVVDPGNGLNARLDVAVVGDHVAAVQPNIPPFQARKVVDVSNLYVVPGLVDLHMHVFGYEGAIAADENALPAGTTTIADAGGSGWRTFDQFRQTVIANSKTRVLVLLNIVGKGMVGEPYESDTEDMDPAKTADTIIHNRDVIVGIKTAHFAKPGWMAIDRAVEAGRRAHVPVMVDDRIFSNMGRTSREELLEHLRPGDIHTHMYNDRQIELIDRFTGKVQPWMLAARERGVLFDVGHGGGSFLWPVATAAVAQGFLPDTISTDLHAGSLRIQQSNMPNVMSKLMLLGMSFEDVLVRSTVNPAKEIGRYPELGTLGVGRVADIAVLEAETGVFVFKDAWPAKRLGTKRLENVLTVRAGKIVYERKPRPPMAQDTTIYDLLIKHGRVGDHSESVDLGIIGNSVAKIGHGLKAAHARVVVEAEGYRVMPAALLEGSVADIKLVDADRVIMIVRGGKVMADDEGLTIPDVSRAGPYSNYR
ncbi:MAG TPA: amidohydrolase/deacetylase family metallohydrolase [Terriglobia bacterium]|nr:amidohydrolase/deacetylase family metallohydrolase [Terriglobia bacterium]